jgi:phosphohistidine phosphatase
MKTLLLMRHAKSSWKDDSLSDHDRPLNGRGKRDAPRMGAWLRSQYLAPDYALTSSAKRALKTAQAVCAACGFQGDLHTLPELYGCGPHEFITALSELPETCARPLIVAHNPGAEIFLERLCGAYETLPTAAIAHIELPISAWPDLEMETQGKLRHCWCPKELP